MNIKSTTVASAVALALGAIVVNSSAAPAITSEASSPSHIAQIAAASEVVEAQPVAFLGVIARAAAKGGAWGAAFTLAQKAVGGRAVDSSSALAATSDALFDYR
jgi:hypothetical protein